jgi:hypothetical protein
MDFSKLVPEVVDRVRPQSQLPPADQLVARLDQLSSWLGR